MTFKNKKIGIWGLGKVGKAALKYFARKNCKIQVLDKRKITQKETLSIINSISNKNHAKFTCIREIEENNTKKFLKYNNLILASPGIDLRKYSIYKEKFITELDILQKEFCKQIISITGSVGKTTVTHILSHILKNSSKKIWTGGNIGTPMLDLLEKKENIDLAILEVSSYQLEHCKLFAPDLALWTNLYPNHLDRHETIENYFHVKLQIIAHQSEQQHALLPLEILDFLDKKNFLNNIKSKLYFFSRKKPNNSIIYKLKTIQNIHALFYLEQKKIIKLSLQDMSKITIGSIEPLSSITFPENSLLILSALNIFNNLFGKSLNVIYPLSDASFKLEHRLEKVKTINKIDFYNDSKSTTMASTIAAVKKLANKPIILLLGGLSKGVDRTPLIKKIKNLTKYPIKIISFGQESQILKSLCTQEKIACKSCKTLEQAVALGFAWARPNDLVLLSPSGSSFDLFKNFEKRGKQFKEIILQIEKQSKVTHKHPI